MTTYANTPISNRPDDEVDTEYLCRKCQRGMLLTTKKADEITLTKECECGGTMDMVEK